jgi:putative tryptophan/tyrosine transport system substrate-binding protein
LYWKCCTRRLGRTAGLPAVYAYPYFVTEGVLVSYGIDPVVEYRQAASYVDRILKGAKPADAKFNLVVNLMAAKALGLTISREFLLLADEVIE